MRGLEQYRYTKLITNPAVGKWASFMRTWGLCSHLCPQEYVRVILRDFFRMLCPRCWSCLSCGLAVVGKSVLSFGEGRCSKGHLFPMLIICPNFCCYLLAMLTSMRAVGYGVLLKSKLSYRGAKIGLQILHILPRSIMELLLDGWYEQTSALELFTSCPLENLLVIVSAPREDDFFYF